MREHRSIPPALAKRGLVRIVDNMKPDQSLRLPPGTIIRLLGEELLRALAARERTKRRRKSRTGTRTRAQERLREILNQTFATQNLDVPRSIERTCNKIIELILIEPQLLADHVRNVAGELTGPVRPLCPGDQLTLMSEDCMAVAGIPALHTQFPTGALEIARS